MGTRSFVGQMVDGKIRAIYVHYDGYLEGVGADLQRFKTDDEVSWMIDAGDRTSIDGPYYKDRGEENVDPKFYDNAREFIEAAEYCGCEYYYLFDGYTWLVGNFYYGNPLYKALYAYDDAVALEKSKDDEEDLNIPVQEPSF